MILKKKYKKIQKQKLIFLWLCPTSGATNRKLKYNFKKIFRKQKEEINANLIV